MNILVTDDTASEAYQIGGRPNVHLSADCCALDGVLLPLLSSNGLESSQEARY